MGTTPELSMEHLSKVDERLKKKGNNRPVNFDKVTKKVLKAKPSPKPRVKP